MKKGFFLLSLMLALVSLNAEEIDVTQPVRIIELIPREKFSFVLGIDPAIPSNFVALNNQADGMTVAYWGPEQVLKEYFQNENLLSEPIIHVFICPMAQPAFGMLDNAAIRNSFEHNETIQDPKVQFGHWGEYPYSSAISTTEGIKYYLAFIGTNSEDGLILVCRLIVPKNYDESKVDELWDRFINETKQLPEPLFFKATGQEMHTGYTIVNIAGHKVKVIAERRKSDNKLRFAVIPEDASVKFQFRNALQCRMGAKWHRNDPLLKMDGVYNVDNGWLYMSMTTSILIKEVDVLTPVDILSENVFFKEL